MSRYSTSTTRTNSASLAIEENKRKSALLKDNSWIRKNEEEDEPVDYDPNFGRSVLSRYKSNETLESSTTTEVKPAKPSSTSSVHALTKRFSGSQDELRNSALPSSKTTSPYTKRYSSVKTDEPTKTTTTTTVIEEPKTGPKTTTVTKNGDTTETTITTTQSIKSSVLKSSSMTETFTERVMSSSKGPQYSAYSPTKTTVTEKTVVSGKDAEDKLYDTLMPKDTYGYPTKTNESSITTTKTTVVQSSPDKTAEDKLYGTLFPYSAKNDVTDSKTSVSTTETVKSFLNGNDLKTTTTTRTSSVPEEDQYGSVLINSYSSSPVRTSITRKEIVTVESSKGRESPTPNSPSTTRTTSYSSYSDNLPSTRTSPYSDNYTSSHKTYSYSRPDSSYEYTSVTSPTVYTTTSYRSSSRSDDTLADPIYTTSTMKNVYGSPERLEKDLCTICRKPFTSEAKMVLEDMNIKSHATCFKCDVCNGTLGHLKAGDSMWIYKRMVHCENCFEITRDKWRR